MIAIQSVEWRAVVGLPLYEVSSEGQIRNAKTGKVLKQCDVGKGYLSVHIGGRTRKVAPIVAEAFLGPIPQGMFVDHKNDVRSENRADNLQYLTIAESNRKRWICGATGFKGVRRRAHGKFQARIAGPTGKQIHLGTFDTAEQAALAYDAAARAHHKEFAVLNFPEVSCG